MTVKYSRNPGHKRGLGGSPLTDMSFNKSLKNATQLLLKIIIKNKNYIFISKKNHWMNYFPLNFKDHN